MKKLLLISSLFITNLFAENKLIVQVGNIELFNKVWEQHKSIKLRNLEVSEEDELTGILLVDISKFNFTNTPEEQEKLKNFNIYIKNNFLLLIPKKLELSVNTNGFTKVENTTKEFFEFFKSKSKRIKTFDIVKNFENQNKELDLKICLNIYRGMDNLIELFKTTIYYPKTLANQLRNNFKDRFEKWTYAPSPLSLKNAGGIIELAAIELGILYATYRFGIKPLVKKLWN